MTRTKKQNKIKKSKAINRRWLFSMMVKKLQEKGGGYV